MAELRFRKRILEVGGHAAAGLGAVSSLLEEVADLLAAGNGNRNAGSPIEFPQTWCCLPSGAMTVTWSFPGQPVRTEAVPTHVLSRVKARSVPG